MPTRHRKKVPSRLPSSRVKDANVDDTIGFRDTLLMCILVEAAAAAEVRPTEMEKQEEEEKEEEVGNRMIIHSAQLNVLHL